MAHCIIGGRGGHILEGEGKGGVGELLEKEIYLKHCFKLTLISNLNSVAKILPYRN